MSPLSGRKEVRWLLSAFAVSIFIVGYLSDFTFREARIRFYDETYVFLPPSGIQNCTLTIYMLRLLWLIIPRITRHRLAALVIAFVNPLIALFFLVVAAYAIQEFSSFRELSPDSPYADRLLAVIALSLIVGILGLVEFRALRTLRNVLNDRPYPHSPLASSQSEDQST